MDITSTKLTSNPGVVSPKTQKLKSSSVELQPRDTPPVSLSALALKLTKAQKAIESEQNNKSALTWDNNNILNPELNRVQVASATEQFEYLSKFQLEIIAMDPSNTFSNEEKIAAYERWQDLEQADITALKNNALKSKNVDNALTSFEAALDTHIQSISSLGKAMLPDQYQSQVTSQYQSELLQLGNKFNSSENRTKDYYTIMVDTLFRGKEPPVQSGVNGMSLENMGRSVFEFLSQDDRRQLADMYQYADQNEIDFMYVTRLGAQLGRYRMYDDGRMLGSYNDSGHFDAQGHRLTVNFSAKDEIIVNNLLASDAMGSTTLDKGFLAFITDEGIGALSYSGNFEFLQHMVEVTAGKETTLNPEKFKTFHPVSRADAYVITASEETYPLPEPDVVCKNGTCVVTELGRKNGVTLDEEPNRFRPAFDLKSESLEALLQLLIHKDTQQKTWIKWLADD